MSKPAEISNPAPEISHPSNAEFRRDIEKFVRDYAKADISLVPEMKKIAQDLENRYYSQYKSWTRQASHDGLMMLCAAERRITRAGERT